MTLYRGPAAQPASPVAGVYDKRYESSDTRTATSAAFAGVLATLRHGTRSTCVALIGDSTGDGKLSGVGPSTDEWPQVLLKRLAADHPAYTLIERRWNDTLQGYDAPVTWQTGTADGGALRAAVFTKATPGSLQYTGAAITGDLDVRAQITPTTWTPTGDQALLARWESGGNQRSFLFMLKASGALSLNWSTNGTTNVGEKNSTATVPTAAGFTPGAPLWVRATLTLDNTATGNDVRFYTSPDGVTWTQLGATITTAGVTTLYGGTAVYQLASFTGGFSNPYDGKIHAVSVRSLSNPQASVVAPLPDDWDYLSGSSTVSFTGAPILTFLNGSSSGQNVTYFDNSTRRGIVHQPHGQAVVMVSSSHNDGTPARQRWVAAYSSLVGNIKTLLPGVPILCLAQNRVGLGGAFTITQQQLELREARGAMLQQWAASQAGVYSFDAWPLTTAADTVDQLHPSTGPGSGSDKWGTALYRSLRVGA